MIKQQKEKQKTLQTTIKDKEADFTEIKKKLQTIPDQSHIGVYRRQIREETGVISQSNDKCNQG